jgi:hypothetical protein
VIASKAANRAGVSEWTFQLVTLKLEPSCRGSDLIGGDGGGVDDIADGDEGGGHGGMEGIGGGVAASERSLRRMATSGDAYVGSLLRSCSGPSGSAQREQGGEVMQLASPVSLNKLTLAYPVRLLGSAARPDSSRRERRTMIGLEVPSERSGSPHSGPRPGHPLGGRCE